MTHKSAAGKSAAQKSAAGKSAAQKSAVPKFGIIGCGNISRFHFNSLEKAGADIVHIADIDEKAAAPWVKKFNTRFSSDYTRLIEDPEVTVVSILVGSSLHYDIASRAIAAGKDVICEKTMMNNAAEAEAIVRQVQASDQLFFTGFMKRFFPAVMKAKELLPSLGRLFSARVRTYQPWGNFFEADNAGDFGFVLGNYGGAVTKCAGSHMLDMMMHLLGRPESLFAHVDYIPETQFDRKTAILFTYPKGMTVLFEAAAHPLKKIGYERNGWDEYIEIDGVNGRLELHTVLWDHPENNAPLLVHYDNERETAVEYRGDPVNPFDDEMEYILHCLTARQEGTPNAVDGFNTDMVIEMAASSAAGRKPVTLDWKGL